VRLFIVAFAYVLLPVIVFSGLGLLVVRYGLLRKADRANHTVRPLLMSCLIASVVSGIVAFFFGENVVIPLLFSMITPFAPYAHIKLQGRGVTTLADDRELMAGQPHLPAMFSPAPVPRPRNKSYAPGWIVGVSVALPFVAISSWPANVGGQVTKDTDYYATQSQSQSQSPMTRESEISNPPSTEDQSPSPSHGPSARKHSGRAQQNTENKTSTEGARRAIALLKTKDWHRLRDWSLKWTENNPKDAFAWYYLGIAYSNLERYDEAAKAWRQYLQLDPKSAGVWGGLGGSYFHLERYDEAAKAYRESLRLDPRNALFWYGLGGSYCYLKRYDEAAKAYRESLRLDPRNALFWGDLGAAYYCLKRYDKAIEAYRESLRLDPENADIWYDLGLAYADSGNPTAVRSIVSELKRFDRKKADDLSNFIASR
jgi:tetratricopeptide (TPR) repeat protein